MKLIAYFIALLSIVSAALAVDIQKSVIVQYPMDTPDSVVDEAKQKIREANGIITHEYKLIKGFAATLGEKILDSVSAMGKEHGVLVEEDTIVTASGNSA